MSAHETAARAGWRGVIEECRRFLPGWGSTAEVWAPFAAPGDRLGGEIETGDEVVAWSLGAMQALEMAGTVEFESLTLVGASGQFVRRAAPTLCQEHLIADLIAISASLDPLMGDSDR